MMNQTIIHVKEEALLSANASYALMDNHNNAKIIVLTITVIVIQYATINIMVII